MPRVFGGKDGWLGILSNSLRASQSGRPFCSKPNNNGDNKLDKAWIQYDEVCKQLDKLDFMTAAKIIITSRPSTKNSAVYLVAKYARYETFSDEWFRQLDMTDNPLVFALLLEFVELEVKKKAEGEAKAKELELKDAEEKESASDPELQEVKVRLGKLEEAIKEIDVIGSKKQQSSTLLQTQDGGEITAASSVDTSSASKEPASKRTKDSVQQETFGSLPITDASQETRYGIPSLFIE